MRRRKFNKGKALGRVYRKPKLYNEKITHMEFTKEERLKMLQNSLKIAESEWNAEMARGGKFSDREWQLSESIRKIKEEIQALQSE